MASSDRGPSLAAGGTSIVGALLMVAGAVTIFSSGADPFATMQADGDALGEGLTAVAQAGDQIVVGFALWLIGAPTMAVGICLLAHLGGNPVWASVARTTATAGAGAAVVFFSLMIGIVVGLAPAHAAGEDVLAATRALGVAADTADWIATVLIVGVGAGSAVLAGRGSWAPRWLQGFAALTMLVGVLTLVLVAVGWYAPAIVIVPVGLAHLIAAGIVAARVGARSRAARSGVGAAS